MPRQVYSREMLARLRARGNDGTFLDRLERAVHAANVSEILRLPTARKSQAPTCDPPLHRSEKGSDSSADTSSSQVIVTLPANTEWQYRGRTGVEVQATQPIQGPTDIKTQKDEGFQRFFKAVSSPGHVRVTAGGRIVPNTRGPNSPNHRKDPSPQVLHPTNSDRASVPRSSNGRPADTPAQAPAAATPYIQQPLGFPAGCPGYPTAIVPPHIPVAPIPWGYHIPPSYVYPPGMPYSPNRRTKQASAAGEESNPKRATPAFPRGSDGAGGVRISPPKQFDPVRPFFVNGQWVMPLAYPPYAVPPVVPHLGFYSHPPPGAHPAQGMAPGSSSTPASTQTTDCPNSSLHSSAEFQNQNTRSNASIQVEAPSNPPISSIRPSQITKSHIESLRQNLKRVDDQLQYNTHQIDVKHMESLAKEIADSIRALEQALPRQLEFEEMHYPKAASEDPKPNGELSDALAPQRGPQYKGIPSDRKRSSARGPLTSAKYGKSVFSLDTGFLQPVGSDGDASKSFSGLPVSAAAAPPFQPSGQIISSSSNSGEDSKGPDNTRALSPSGRNKHVAALGIKNQLRDGLEIQSHALNGHAHAQTFAPPANVTRQPYLVGYLPLGIEHAAAQQSEDYVYPRQLSPEEVRARHLYWGQAPPSATKGLPIFDGKDFYPPSPTKSRDGDRSMAPGVGFTASRTDTTDPFSSGESRNAETHTRVTSYSVSDEVGGKKPEVNEVVILNHSSSVRIRRGEDRSSDRKTNEILQMLKKGSTSSAALPGEVSSMTAQGLLPQYTVGNAAASLTPAISHANVGGQSSSRSLGKVGGNDGKGTPESPLTAKRSENHPPPSDFVVESVRNLRF